MTNRWTLTKEVRREFTPIIQKFIDDKSLSSLDLSDTKLNPYTLGEILEELGYEKTEIDSNGWEMDFSIHYNKEGHTELVLSGTGITFELKIEIRE